MAETTIFRANCGYLYNNMGNLAQDPISLIYRILTKRGGKKWGRDGDNQSLPG